MTTTVKLRDLLEKYKVVNELSADDIQELKTIYCKLLYEVASERAYGDDTEEHIQAVANRVNQIIGWLEDSQFFTSPASTRYHENFEGGLLLHTLRVVAEIVDIHSLPKFNNRVNLCDAVLVALVHDWCKMGNYEGYMRNVKNEDTGRWEQVRSYRYVSRKQLPLGHGIASAYLANRMFKLSVEEYAAILYHMGLFEHDTDYSVNDMTEAANRYPLVRMLQFADQLSITEY